MNGSDPPDGSSQQDQVPREGAVGRVLEIINKKGLHARASARFVQTAERFDAAVTVTRGNDSVGGTSIMGLMMLAAEGGFIAAAAMAPGHNRNDLVNFDANKSTCLLYTSPSPRDRG